MAIDVYFRDDIANVLRSIASDGGAPPDLVKLIRNCDDPKKLADLVQAFQHGRTHALCAVADGFGIVTFRE